MNSYTVLEYKKKLLGRIREVDVGDGHGLDNHSDQLPARGFSHRIQSNVHKSGLPDLDSDIFQPPKSHLVLTWYR